MTALSNLAAQRPLSQTWRDWTAIVQLFANKRPAREQIAETVYREIHQEVTASLNDMRELDAKPENSGLAGLCDRLNALARPWVTLNALRAADPRITQNLLLLCQAGQTEIDAQVGSSAAQTLRADSSVELRCEIASQFERQPSAWGAVCVFVLLFVGVIAIGFICDSWTKIDDGTLAADTRTDGPRSKRLDTWIQQHGDLRYWLITGFITLATGTTAWTVIHAPRDY